MKEPFRNEQKLVFIHEAIALLDHAHNWDYQRIGRHAFSPKTLKNAMWKGRIKRFGPRHQPMVCSGEVLREWGPK